MDCSALPSRKKANEQKRQKKRERAYKLLEDIDKQPTAQHIIIREKEIVKEEIKMINCSYCNALMESTSIKCPHCGAPRKK